MSGFLVNSESRLDYTFWWCGDGDLCTVSLRVQPAVVGTWAQKCLWKLNIVMKSCL